MQIARSPAEQPKAAATWRVARASLTAAAEPPIADLSTLCALIHGVDALAERGLGLREHRQRLFLGLLHLLANVEVLAEAVRHLQVRKRRPDG